MTNELDVMRALSAVVRSKCWRQKLTDQELAATVDEALGHGDITATAISIYLKQKGVNVGQAVVARHRRKNCGCYE
jgi:hypothetical protein